MSRQSQTGRSSARRGPFRATRYVSALPLVDVSELVGEGVRLVLLDRDNTCVPRDAKVPPAAVMEWLDRARDAGLTLCLVSNNFHSDQVRGSAEHMGMDVVDHAMKPLPIALRRAMRMEGFSPRETVMIGDQVFTDVVAGNLAGVLTILVRPQSRKDLWYTHIFRVFERLALRGVTFDGE